MADAQAPQRSLWLQILWKPVFRSRRERVVYHSVAFVLFFGLFFPALYLDWLDSILIIVSYGIGMMILHAAVTLAWLTRGRERFPLRAPDESRSTA